MIPRSAVFRDIICLFYFNLSYAQVKDNVINLVGEESALIGFFEENIERELDLDRQFVNNDQFFSKV